MVANWFIALVLFALFYDSLHDQQNGCRLPELWTREVPWLSLGVQVVGSRAAFLNRSEHLNRPRSAGARAGELAEKL